jgi:hypothetical protein
MNPRQYEELVCEHFCSRGYKAQTTSYGNDYGVDIFAEKGKEKIAIQVKMYGSGRKINRQMIMELYGAKEYFDCTKAIIATDGSFLESAILVAQKLKIEILQINSIRLNDESIQLSKTNHKLIESNSTFDAIWKNHIIPLKGKFLARENGEVNEIIEVNWGEIHRISSKGKKGKIKIEIFKYSINKLLTDHYITRDDINQNYPGRASSGIILILSQVPFFQLTNNPVGLKYNMENQT